VATCVVSGGTAKACASPRSVTSSDQHILTVVVSSRPREVHQWTESLVRGLVVHPATVVQAFGLTPRFFPSQVVPLEMHKTRDKAPMQWLDRLGPDLWWHR
jgi:hypothetical protein